MKPWRFLAVCAAIRPMRHLRMSMFYGATFSFFVMQIDVKAEPSEELRRQMVQESQGRPTVFCGAAAMVMNIKEFAIRVMTTSDKYATRLKKGVIDPVREVSDEQLLRMFQYHM